MEWRALHRKRQQVGQSYRWITAHQRLFHDSEWGMARVAARRDRDFPTLSPLFWLLGFWRAYASAGHHGSFMIVMFGRFALIELLLCASFGSWSNALVKNLCRLKAGEGWKPRGSCSVHIFWASMVKVLL